MEHIRKHYLKYAILAMFLGFPLVPQFMTVGLMGFPIYLFCMWAVPGIAFYLGLTTWITLKGFWFMIRGYWEG